jgi:hypothetical protein
VQVCGFCQKTREELGAFLRFHRGAPAWVQRAVGLTLRMLGQPRTVAVTPRCD